MAMISSAQAYTSEARGFVLARVACGDWAILEQG